MDQKKKLLGKLTGRGTFTKRELATLMRLCDCEERSGGRGSGICYYHSETARMLMFDLPHPSTELYRYHVKRTIEFLKEIGAL